MVLMVYVNFQKALEEAPRWTLQQHKDHQFLSFMRLRFDALPFNNHFNCSIIPFASEQVAHQLTVPALHYMTCTKAMTLLAKHCMAAIAVIRSFGAAEALY